MAEMTKVKNVGKYQRGEKIGYGNFGVVYKGLETHTNRVVAIKTLDLDTINDEVESVQHEVELLSHLSKAESSNVTKYYGTVLEGSKLWIIMDLCSGGSVRTLLKAGPMEDKFLGVIFRELTIAVVAIHREGIIHRDIKAANVLITMAGQVKLCDFGVAANTSLSSNAKRQTIVGTPYWMAPEVITEGQSYTNKADIWSMGITFYEIITGNPPYHEHEAMRALMLITNSRPPRLEGPKYTPNLKDLVAYCLDEDPEARPGAEEVLKHKFLKTHMKTPTSVLRMLVDRYIKWKNSHRDHRDSLLMFNPHPDNDDNVSVLNHELRDDDGDSVWDFNIDEDSSDSNEKTIAQTGTGKEDDGLTASSSLATGSSTLQSSIARAPLEDLSDAPDSLREIFGVPPKSDEGAAFARSLKRNMTDSVVPSSISRGTSHFGSSGGSGSSSQRSDSQTRNNTSDSAQQLKPASEGEPASYLSPPDLGANMKTKLAGIALPVQPQSSIQPPPQHSHLQMQLQNPSQLQVDTNVQPYSQLNAASHLHGPHSPALNPASQTSQGFVFPPAKPFPSQERDANRPVLGRAATTTASAPRSRSTTSTGVQGGWSGYRSRHGSDVPEVMPENQDDAFQQQQHLQQQQQQQHLQQQLQQLQLQQAPNLQQPHLQQQSQPVLPQQTSSSPSSVTESPSGSPSPKRTSGRRRIPADIKAKTRETLPRLQMPSRNVAKPLPLMSAPAGPVRHNLGASISSDQSLNLGPQSATGSESTSFSTLKRLTDWPSEFPPMPQLDTNVLLDTTPDDLVVDHLLELTTGFKVAIASLASQLEDFHR